MMMVLDATEMTMMANASCSSSADVPKAKRLEADAGRRWPPTVVAEVVLAFDSMLCTTTSYHPAEEVVFWIRKVQFEV